MKNFRKRKSLFAALFCVVTGFCMTLSSLTSINNTPLHAEANEITLWEDTPTDMIWIAQSSLPEDKPELFFVELDGSNDILYIYDNVPNEIKCLPSSSHFVITFTDQEWSSIYDGGTLNVNTGGGACITKISYVPNGQLTITVAEIDCPTCHGDGLAQCSECFGLGCDACNGGNVPCTNCNETGKISFTTLEDAISAVTYYGKITLLKDNSEEIEISEEAVFIIDKASFTFDKSKITAGTGYDVSTRENGTETTFIVTHQKTIASILPEDFPTFSMPLSDKVWVNANCATSKLYKNLFNGLTFGSIEQYVDFQNILTAPVTKVENGYKFTKDSYTITFVMDDFDKLVQINLAGSGDADINGTYVSNTVIVTVAAGEHGAVSYADSYYAQRSSAYTIDGATLTFGGDSFTATPEEGYVFDKWVIDGQKVTGGTFSKNVTITATFKKENTGAKFFLKIFYIYGFTLSVKDDQSILDWVFALENLGNGKVIFDFTINDIIDGIGDLIDDVKDLIVDVQEFAEKLSHEIDDLFVSFLDDVLPYASVVAFALEVTSVIRLYINIISSITLTYHLN